MVYKEMFKPRKEHAAFLRTWFGPKKGPRFVMAQPPCGWNLCWGALIARGPLTLLPRWQHSRTCIGPHQPYEQQWRVSHRTAAVQDAVLLPSLPVSIAVGARPIQSREVWCRR